MSSWLKTIPRGGEKSSGIHRCAKYPCSVWRNFFGHNGGNVGKFLPLEAASSDEYLKSPRKSNRVPRKRQVPRSTVGAGESRHGGG